MIDELGRLEKNKPACAPTLQPFGSACRATMFDSPGREMRTVPETELQRLAVNNIGNAPSPLGNYSHAVWAGNTLFVAGQGARDAATGKEAGVVVDDKGNVVSYDIAAQTRAVLHNLTLVLKAAGCTLQDLVDVTVFLKDMNDFEKYNQVYSEYFGFPNPPARTTVQVAGLPGKNFIEIKAIACKSRS
ncbi:MAG TPA: RidA family protein [Planktothrix sp.]|jgi:reactive intermediate/imine deaminase